MNLGVWKYLIGNHVEKITTTEGSNRVILEVRLNVKKKSSVH